VAEHRGSLLAKIETAIVDGADQVSDPERGVFRLSEIDDLLQTEGAGDCISQVREAFKAGLSKEIRDRLQDHTFNEGLAATYFKAAKGGRIAGVPRWRVPDVTSVNGRSITSPPISEIPADF